MNFPENAGLLVWPENDGWRYEIYPDRENAAETLRLLVSAGKLPPGSFSSGLALAENRGDSAVYGSPLGNVTIEPVCKPGDVLLKKVFTAEMITAAVDEGGWGFLKVASPLEKYPFPHPKPERYYRISESELRYLVQESKTLEALHGHLVDDWEGYEEAISDPDYEITDDDLKEYELLPDSGEQQ